MNLFEIATTSWKEENFFLETSLSKEQVIEVIAPIKEYNNDDLIAELIKRYPNEKIEMSGFELIEI